MCVCVCVCVLCVCGLGARMCVLSSTLCLLTKAFQRSIDFLYRICLDIGCPHHGIISDIKRKAHAKYKQAVKLVKRNQSDMRATKMATALQRQDKYNFCFETKRINNNHSSLINVVDAARGDKDITNTFANKYKQLYNSVSYTMSTI